MGENDLTIRIAIIILVAFLATVGGCNACIEEHNTHELKWQELKVRELEARKACLCDAGVP